MNLYIRITESPSCTPQTNSVGNQLCERERVSRSLTSDSWSVARQDPVSMGFSRKEYWSGLPFPSPGDLPDPEIEPMSPALQALAGGFFTPEQPGKPYIAKFHP